MVRLSTLAPVLFLCLSTALAQKPIFEVASIKPNTSGRDGGTVGPRGDRLVATNVPLNALLSYAYAPANGVLLRSQIVGAPDWAGTDRFDIQAKREGDARTLPIEQTKLEFRHELRTIPGYALTVAKGGLKAKVADPNRYSGANGGRGFIDAVACPVSELTIRLSALPGRPVVDMTGEKRTFDFHLRWTPDDTQTGANSVAPDSPSLFTALQEQLGLKLESGKVPVDILVVDHAELPSNN